MAQIANSRTGSLAPRVFLGAVMVAAAAGAMAIAAGVPVFGSADEAAHVDYAFQVWQGQLPVFQDGLLLPTHVGARPPVQWVAQHPPLFYLLLAPVVGPLADAHHVVAAAMAARLITILLAVATAFASVWAARWILPRGCSGARFVAPVVMVSSPWFWRLGGAVYNDILLILVVTILLGLTARIIRRGEGRLDVLWLTLILAGGALTRLSFVPLALACLGALAVAQLIRAPRNLGAWARMIAVPSAAALAASGWFYRRNVELTGSVAGGNPDWAVEHLGRVQRSVGDVLGSAAFWRPSLQQFAASPQIGEQANVLLFVLPAGGGFILAAVFVVRGIRARAPQALPADDQTPPPGSSRSIPVRGIPARGIRAWAERAFPADLLVLGLVVVCVVGVFAQQALYSSTGGGAKGRYFAMLLLLFSLAIAVTMTWLRPLGPWLLAGWLAIHAVDLFLDLRSVLAHEFPQPSAAVYPVAVWAGFGIHLAALVVALASYAASNRRHTVRVPALSRVEIGH